MEVVKMVTKVAGEEVFVGECHPARARVLVKRQLASWMDGKVLLHVLNVHDKLLSSNPEAARGPLDDNNVSKQEMERRLAWFRSFMERSSRALVAGVVELPTVEDAKSMGEEGLPPKLSEDGLGVIRVSLLGRVQSFFIENKLQDDRAVFLAGVLNDAYEAVINQAQVEGVVLVDAWQVARDLVDGVHLESIPEDEVQSFFVDEPLPVVEESLEGVWVSDPDVSAEFGPDAQTLAEERMAELAASLWEDGVVVSPREGARSAEPVPPTPPAFDLGAYKLQRERDARLLTAQRGSLEEQPRPVATLQQVKATHSRLSSGAMRVWLSPVKSS